MISLSQLINASASLTLGAGTAVQTEIAADFRHGSFSFLAITAGPDVARQAAHLLSTMTMKDLLEVLGLTGGGGGLIGLILWLRKRRIASVTPVNDDKVTITANDGQSTVVHAQTVVLFQNSSVRLNLDGIVAPLRADGMTELRAGRPGEQVAVVPADAVDFFEPPVAVGETLQDKVSTEIVQVDTLSLLSPGRKWRFVLPDGTGFSSALDAEFAKRVRSHDVVFGAGDALEVQMRTVVTRDPFGTLHAQRSIEAINSMIPAPKLQIPLDFDAGDNDGPYRA